MNHIDEKTLVQYTLDDEKIKDRQRDIEEHLNSCAGCASLCQEIKQYYDQVDRIRQQQAREVSQALTLRSMIVQAPPYLRYEQIGYRRPTLPARVVFFIVRHPIVSTMSFAALFAGALLLATMKFTPTDTNPAYARAKDEFLIAYNHEGEKLWSKHVGMGYDFESMLRNDPNVSIDNLVTTADVDRDGKNEVIAQFGWIPKPLTEKVNSIACYNSNGSERWKYEFHRSMTFGTEKFSDDYRFVKMIVGDLERKGKVELIAVALHTPYYPSAIIKLDARDGSLLSEYWHCGSSGVMFGADLDGDGITELLFAGSNNGFNQAHLLVLDPRIVTGHNPAPVTYTPVGIPEGLEKYYILLPQTDLNKASPQRRNTTAYIRPTGDGLLEVGTQEDQDTKPYPGIMYFFDRSLKCVRVDADDYFVEAHRKMVEDGKLTKKLGEQYYEQLRQGVRYWDGEKFVKEPSQNQLYLKALSERMLP